MDTIMTTVKLKRDDYLEFKKQCLNNNLNLQQFINSSIQLYNKNKDFAELIHTIIDQQKIEKINVNGNS